MDAKGLNYLLIYHFFSLHQMIDFISLFLYIYTYTHHLNYYLKPRCGQGSNVFELDYRES